MLKLKQIDALIICSRNISLNIVEQYIEYGPISIFENISNSKFRTTFIDHYNAFKQALNHLYNNGHRHIACAINRRNSTSSILRIKAYKDFCSENALPFNDQDIYENFVLLEDGQRLAQEIDNKENPPTAIVVSGDNTVAGLFISLNDEQKKTYLLLGLKIIKYLNC